MMHMKNVDNEKPNAEKIFCDKLKKNCFKKNGIFYFHIFTESIILVIEFYRNQFKIQGTEFDQNTKSVFN